MTAPGALPTREEIAALLFTAHEQWLGEGLHSTYMERGIVTWDKVALQTQKAYFVMADALLARLRPAWEQTEQNYLESISNMSVAAQDLIQQRDAICADLRACAEALRELVADETPVDVVAFGLSVQKARAALARPGVQEALRSEPKATAP